MSTTMYKTYSRTRSAMRILAIDPGYDRLGVAVLEGSSSRPILIWSDCLSPDKGTASERLSFVSSSVSSAIKKYSPDILAIETLFFSVNKKTAIKVAEARGAILAAAGLKSVPVIEFSPQQIKLAVTGHGGADKKSIARMVPLLLVLPKRKRLDDELDAIAIGITALAVGFHKQ